MNVGGDMLMRFYDNQMDLPSHFWICRCGTKKQTDNMWRAGRSLAQLGPALPVLAYYATQRDTSCQLESRGRLRKHTTLRQATHPIARRSTRAELAELRHNEDEMLDRWEKDEEGWRELPARAWPAFQHDEKEMKEIKKSADDAKCTVTNTSSTCQSLLFQIATTLVFYNLDPEAGLEQFDRLASQGHVDSMVACGVVLVEGLGVSPDEQKGIQWLEKAISLGSSQACYELATVYYTGIDGIVQEDPERAFALFERAAKDNHTAAMYMTADCLVEGEGTKVNVARSIPLFYQAAERGHRFARQRIREVLKSKAYR